jgi:cytochrome c oxidase subunit 1
LERTAFWAYVIAGLGFSLVFLTAGAMSVPRRWAVHAPEWIAQDRITALLAVVIVLGASYFVLRYAIRLVTSRIAQ